MAQNPLPMEMSPSLNGSNLSMNSNLSPLFPVLSVVKFIFATGFSFFADLKARTLSEEDNLLVLFYVGKN